ncbi:hypothetical protein ABK040_013745 [Willaertia magna]
MLTSQSSSTNLTSSPTTRTTTNKLSTESYDDINIRSRSTPILQPEIPKKTTPNHSTSCIDTSKCNHVPLPPVPIESNASVLVSMGKANTLVLTKNNDEDDIKTNDNVVTNVTNSVLNIDPNRHIPLAIPPFKPRSMTSPVNNPPTNSSSSMAKAITINPIVNNNINISSTTNNIQVEISLESLHVNLEMKEQLSESIQRKMLQNPKRKLSKVTPFGVDTRRHTLSASSSSEQILLTDELCKTIENFKTPTPNYIFPLPSMPTTEEEIEERKHKIREELSRCDKLTINLRLYTACKEADLFTASFLFDEYFQSIDVNFMNHQDSSKNFLHVCARTDMGVPIMEILLENNSNPNTKDKISRTPLHVACSSGSHNALVLLLGHGANPNQRDEFGFSPLYLALRQHRWNMIKDLLLFGADINLKQFDGSTLLHEFLSNGDIQAVKFLLELPGTYNLLTNVKNEHGMTALHAAIQNSQIDTLKYLFNSKFEQQIFSTIANVSMNSENVFHIVAKSGDVDMLSLLLTVFNEKEIQSTKVLQDQSKSKIPTYKKNIVGEKVFQLLNVADSTRKFTPLIIAAKGKKSTMVRELLKLTTKNQNCSGELMDKKKKLHRAVDVNMTDKRGNTALHYAVANFKDNPNGTSEQLVLQYLLQCKNIKKDIKNEKQMSVRDFVKKFNLNIKL